MARPVFAQDASASTPATSTGVAKTDAQNPPGEQPRAGTVTISEDEGIVFTAPGDVASLRLGTVVVIRGEVTHTEADGFAGNFQIRNVRLRLGGHVVKPWLQYKVQFELANPHLLDAIIKVAPSAIFQLTAGQFLQPFGGEFEPNPAEYMMPESSPVGSFFGLGRDAGAMVEGHTAEDHYGYWLTLVLGNPVALTGDVKIRDALGVARFQLQPVGKVPEHQAPYSGGDVGRAVAIGVSGYAGRLVRSTTRYDSFNGDFGTDVIGRFAQGVGSVDLRYVEGRLSMLAEIDGGWRKQIDNAPPNAQGLWAVTGTAQAGVFVYSHILELATRWSVLDPDLSTGGDLFGAGELEVAAYPFGSHAAALLRYGLARQSRAGDPITTLGQEWIHVGTLQLETFF